MTSEPKSDPSTWPRYSAANLPPGEPDRFRKRVVTRAWRIEGPFAVVTPWGVMHCLDGWLALDIRGEPYAIEADVMPSTYAPEP